MNRVVLWFLVAIFLFGGLTVSAQDKPEIKFSAGNQIFTGFTQYELNFLWFTEDYFKAFGHSRLKFPYTVFMAGGSSEISYKNFTAEFGYWGSYHSNKKPNMEDFDWITSNFGEIIQLAYGKSTPYPTLNNYNIGVNYNFRFKNVRMGPYFDYAKYHSEFLAVDLEQTWFYDLEYFIEFEPPVESSVPGQVLYYEQDLTIPMIGLNFDYITNSQKFEVETSIGYTFFASVEDYDDHIIREDSLEAWNSGDGGQGLKIDVVVRWNVFNSLWLSGSFGYQDYNINTTGRQRSINRETEQWETFTGLGTQVRGVMRKFKALVTYYIDL